MPLEAYGFVSDRPLALKQTEHMHAPNGVFEV